MPKCPAHTAFLYKERSTSLQRLRPEGARGGGATWRFSYRRNVRAFWTLRIFGAHMGVLHTLIDLLEAP